MSYFLSLYIKVKKKKKLDLQEALKSLEFYN